MHASSRRIVTSPFPGQARPLRPVHNAELGCTEQLSPLEQTTLRIAYGAEDYRTARRAECAGPLPLPMPPPTRHDEKRAHSSEGLREQVTAEPF